MNTQIHYMLPVIIILNIFQFSTLFRLRVQTINKPIKLDATEIYKSCNTLDYKGC